MNRQPTFEFRCVLPTTVTFKSGGFEEYTKAVVLLRPYLSEKFHIDADIILSLIVFFT